MSKSPDYPVAPEMLCNVTAVLQAARHLSKCYNRALSSVGLRATQYALLVLVSRPGETSIPDLAEVLIMDRSNIGHNLRPLERDGLITVSPGNPDKRRRIIELTAEGRARLEAGAEAWRIAQEQFEALFGAEDAREMRKAMARIKELPLG